MIIIRVKLFKFCLHYEFLCQLLGYPTSVVEGVGDEFISVRESLIS